MFIASGDLTLVLSILLTRLWSVEEVPCGDESSCYGGGGWAWLRGRRGNEGVEGGWRRGGE